MAPSSRDRISVDLRGLKAALIERAHSEGTSPSDFVRALLADALRRAAPSTRAPLLSRTGSPSRGERVRLSVRIRRQDMEAIILGADRANLPVGAYVAGLAAGIPVVSSSTAVADHLATLVASNAAMATLSRSLNHVTSLLRQGSTRVAQEYREMLDGIASEVDRHLAFASAALADLRPLCASYERQRAHSARKEAR